MDLGGVELSTLIATSQSGLGPSKSNASSVYLPCSSRSTSIYTCKIDANLPRWYRDFLPALPIRLLRAPSMLSPRPHRCRKPNSISHQLKFYHFRGIWLFFFSSSLFASIFLILYTCRCHCRLSRSCPRGGGRRRCCFCRYGRAACSS